MGYSTDFEGKWTLDRPLTLEHYLTLTEFAEQRHNLGNNLSNYCQWIPVERGTAIAWDEGEKFYEYENWARYLVNEFLEPWGYKLNGEIHWDGESQGDVGILIMKDNVLTVKEAKITYD